MSNAKQRNESLSKTKTLCLTAVFMALTFVITRFGQIPIPLGYFNVGNSIILLGCLILPLSYGIAVGGIGSALADLTSYPVYTLPTLVIKSLMPLVFFLLLKLPIKNEYVKALIAFSVSTLIPLVGYTLTGCVLYGGFIAGLAQLPGLALEYAANIAIFAALYFPFKQIKRYI